MKTNEILKELIDYLSLYEQEANDVGTQVNFTDFLGFLNSHHVPQNVKVSELRGNFPSDDLTDRDGPDTDISILIVLMFRYAKGYIKKAMKDSMINTADEFSFLITLMTHESLSKTELIVKQVMEKTSGTEIINRLLKLGMVEQFNDEVDKRSVRVKITLMGRMELVKVLPNMNTVSQIVAGNLNETEKFMLAYMLRKLEHYHNDIFLNKKDAELIELAN
jgi:DNA-binding MarR family transcriptional regulator